MWTNCKLFRLKNNLDNSCFLPFSNNKYNLLRTYEHYKTLNQRTQDFCGFCVSLQCFLFKRTTKLNGS